MCYLFLKQDEIFVNLFINFFLNIISFECNYQLTLSFISGAQ